MNAVLNPSPMDLLAAPELAVVTALEATLDATAAALVAAHLVDLDPTAEPETRREPDEPEPAAASVARAVLTLAHSLRAQLAAYRNALDADRYREHQREVSF